MSLLDETITMITASAAWDHLPVLLVVFYHIGFERFVRHKSSEAQEMTHSSPLQGPVMQSPLMFIVFYVFIAPFVTAYLVPASAFPCATRFNPLRDSEQALLVLVMLIGMSLRLWAMVTLDRFFTRDVRTVEGQVVVTGGPYAWVRHPGYAANFLVWIPYMVVYTENKLLVTVAVFVFARVYWTRMQREEGMMLTGTTRPQYRQYMRVVVDRLFPGWHLTLSAVGMFAHWFHAPAYMSISGHNAHIYLLFAVLWVVAELNRSMVLMPWWL